MANIKYPNYSIEELDTSFFTLLKKTKVYYVHSKYIEYIRTKEASEEYKSEQSKDELEFIKQYEEIANLKVTGLNLTNIEFSDKLKFLMEFSTPSERAIIMAYVLYGGFIPTDLLCIYSGSSIPKGYLASSREADAKELKSRLSSLKSLTAIISSKNKKSEILNEETIAFSKCIEFLDNAKLVSINAETIFELALIVEGLDSLNLTKIAEKCESYGGMELGKVTNENIFSFKFLEVHLKTVPKTIANFLSNNEKKKAEKAAKEAAKKAAKEAKEAEKADEENWENWSPEKLAEWEEKQAQKDADWYASQDIDGDYY